MFDKESMKASSQFLNAIFDQITSAIFIVDQSFKVLEFNEAFQTMVSKPREGIVNHLCGNVLGCTFAVEANAPCGTTAFCNQCDLRKSVESTLHDQKEIVGQIIEREFLFQNELERKYFRYSTKPLTMDGNHYVLLIVDDLTDIETKKSELLEQNALIRKLNDKFQNEMALARRVQRNIMPSKPFYMDDYTIKFRYYPLDLIGGDMFDFYPLDDHLVGVFICDVVGHGLPAALVTTMIKAIIEEAKHLLTLPARFVKHLNRRMMTILGDIYVTMIYGVLDTEEHSFNFVRAGHPHPWLIEGPHLTPIGQATNMLMGVDSEYTFTDETLVLGQGQKLMLYTDGLVESGFSEENYAHHLSQALLETQDMDSETLLKVIDRDVLALKKVKHEDDICVLIIERKK